MNKLDVILLLSESVDLVLSSLLDSDSATAERKRKQVVVTWVNSLITKCLGQCHRTFPVGSLLTNICLLTSPISNISLTASFGETVQPIVNLSFWLDSSNSSWYLNVFESLCEHFLNAEKLSSTTAVVRKKEALDGSHMTVERISYFPAEERLEALVNGISFNTVPNDFCSLGYSAILDEFDKKISKGNFFKRCLLLIKTWTLHEASNYALFHGSEDDFLVSMHALKTVQDEKVVEIMTMWFFNSKVVSEKSLCGVLQGLSGAAFGGSNYDVGQDGIANPILVLVLFLDHFSRFEWTKWAISVNGLIPLPSCMSPLSTGSCETDPFADIKLGDTPVPLGTLGHCDEYLSSIVGEQRAILRANKLPLSSATAVPILSPLFSPSPSISERTQNKFESNSSYSAAEESSGGSASMAGPSPLESDVLPSNFLTNDICIIHPLTGLNLCTAHAAAMQTGLLGAQEQVFSKQTALKEIFSLGLNKLVSVIHSSITVSAAQSVASDRTENTSAVDTGCKSKAALSTAEQCFPSLFRSNKGRPIHQSKPSTSGAATSSFETVSGSADPVCLRSVLRANVPPAPYAQDTTVFRLDPPTPYSERETANEFSPFEMSKTEGIYETSTAQGAAGSTGSRTPLGAWGGETILTPKGPGESGTHYTKKSSDTSRGSNSPTVHSTEGYLDRANLQALKFENKLDYFSERALETYLENGSGRSSLTSQAGIGYKGDSPPFSRGSPPVFTTKTGSISVKLPSHSIQPYLKKEEQLWVPGKFSSESSHSPAVTLTSASREGSVNSSSSASNVASSFISQNTSKESSFSLSSRRGTIVGRGSSNGSLAADTYQDRSSPIPPMGAISLGPGLLTGKTAIVHSRSLDGSTSDCSGSYSFASGHSMDNIDSQLDSGEYNSNSERHRANQLALAGRHQQIQRQKSATNQQPLYVGRMSSGGSGDDQFYLSPSTSGQRSPALSSLMQQRLCTPSQSQSSPHLSPHTPPHNLSHPATLHLSQQQGSLSPPYSHLHHSPSTTGPDPEIVKQNYKAGFEAQLPSFLRDL